MARDAEIAAPGYDTDRIRRHVMSNDEADAVAAVVEAGRALARTWFASRSWGKPHVPDAIALREALQRLGEDRV